jgi:hypothetical protein
MIARRILLYDHKASRANEFSKLAVTHRKESDEFSVGSYEYLSPYLIVQAIPVSMAD